MHRSSTSPRTVGTLAAALAATAVLAACSSTTDGAAQATGASSSEGSAPSSSSSGSPTDLTALALTQADFPPGYQVQQVTAEQLQAASEGGLGGATVSPAECAAAVEATGQIDYSRSGIASAANPDSGTVLTATVSPLVVEVAQLRKQVAACTTLTITSPDIGEATGTLTEVDVPDVGADGAIGTDSTVTFSVNGQSGSITTTSVVAEVRGVQVSVGAVSLAGGPVDTTTVTDLLRTQVEKVLNG